MSFSDILFARPRHNIHQLKQASGETVDDFINKVCQHAKKCAFKCTNDSCTAKDSIHKTLIRDQIIIGTNIASSREDALEREYDLATPIAKALKIEATEIAQKELESEPPSSSFQIGSADTEKPENGQ